MREVEGLKLQRPASVTILHVTISWGAHGEPLRDKKQPSDDERTLAQNQTGLTHEARMAGD